MMNFDKAEAVCQRLTRELGPWDNDDFMCDGGLVSRIATKYDLLPSDIMEMLAQ